MTPATLFIDNKPVATLAEAKRAAAVLNDPNEHHTIKFSSAYVDAEKAVDLRRHAEYVPEDAVYRFECRPWRKHGYGYGPEFSLRYDHETKRFGYIR